MSARRLTALILTVAGMALTAGPAGPAGAGAGPARAQAAGTPARLMVYAQEWSLWPSRSSIRAGSVVVQLWNRGQDGHNLQIRRLNSRGAMVGPAQGAGITQSGLVKQVAWHLGPGTYELYCSMPGHLKAGMHARLSVR
jgi:plastocyanin